MASPIDLITYESAGFPVELAEELDWRREILRHRLRRTSEVTVYRAGSPPRRQLAETVAELQALFDELDPQPASAQPPRAVVSPAAFTPPPPSWDAGTSEPIAPSRFDPHAWVDPPKHVYQPLLEPLPELMPAPARTQRPPMRPEAKSRIILALILVPLFLIALIEISGSDGGTAPAPATLSWSVSEPANVRDAPNVQGSRIVATLPPGQAVSGTIVADGPGEDWVRISAGRHRGRYVWTGNLTRAPAPARP